MGTNAAVVRTIVGVARLLIRPTPVAREVGSDD